MLTLPTPVMRFKRDPGPTEARGNDAAVERSSEAERSLLERARRLDMRAHAEIFDAHYPAIFRYLRLRLPDAELAEDLGAEVFTRLPRNLVAAIFQLEQPHTLEGVQRIVAEVEATTRDPEYATVRRVKSVCQPAV